TQEGGMGLGPAPGQRNPKRVAERLSLIPSPSPGGRRGSETRAAVFSPSLSGRRGRGMRANSSIAFLDTLLRLLPVASMVWPVLTSSVARADDAPRPTQHRIVVEGGVSPIMGTKPDYGEDWRVGLGLRAAYYYRPITYIELGANFTFWGVP